MAVVLHVSEDVDKLWVKAKECGYIVTPPSSPQATRKHFDLEKKQRELEEEAECRRALRERDIPPYFDSDVAACFEKLVYLLHCTLCSDKNHPLSFSFISHWKMFMCIRKFQESLGGIMYFIDVNM